MNNKKTNRRNFLKTSAVLGASMFLPKSIAMATGGSSDDQRIIVIGAGLAGLSCAYELKESGYNVLLLEARSRPGGRVRTYRDPFADGLYAEMGAEYVDSSDEHVRKYAKEFALPILPAKQYDGIYVRGQHIAMADMKSGKVALPYNGIEQGKLFAQEAAYLQDWIKMVQELGESSKEIQALDKMSVTEILRKGGAPQDIIDLIPIRMPPNPHPSLLRCQL